MKHTNIIVGLMMLIITTVVLASENNVTLYNDVATAEFILSTMIAFAAASLGGAARTSTMLKSTAINKEGTSFKFFIADQISALVTGLVAFSICEAHDVSNFMEIVVIIVAGYSGSILLDALQGVILTWIKNKSNNGVDNDKS